MAEIKGLAYGEDNVKFVSLNGGTIDGDLIIDGDLTVDGILTAETSGGNPFAPVNIKNINIEVSRTTLKLTWEDSSDTIDADGQTLVKWAGTKVVYNTSHYPSSITDGTLAIDNAERNKYKDNPLEITDIDTSLTYYIQLFPYSVDNVYNTNVANQIEWSKPAFEIVTFKDGTDAQIAAMLEAHYNGDINIEEYWHVGDTRKIHINATNSGSKAHVAQDMTMVIMDFNHDDLTTSINGKTKAAVSVGFREIMGNNGTSEDEYYWGSSHYPVNDNENYSASPLRTWLNGGLLNALPSTFSSIIKEVNKKNLQYHTKTDGAPLITKDKIWLLSYPEIFGTTKYQYYLNNADPSNYEGEQYQYFATSSNRIKYPNKNGEKGSAYYYWLRSPSSYYYSSIGYLWCCVLSDGSASINSGYDTCGLAPAFAL